MQETSIQLFEHERFGKIRTTTIDGEPWFVARDVCDALELSNVSVSLNALDEDERAKFNLGRQGETNIISEAGMYSLVMRSRKPEAKSFKRWVTHEVLPAIRQNGYYATPEKDSEITAREKFVQKAITDPRSVISILQTLADKIDENERLSAENEAMKPKALFADSVTASSTSILVGELSTILQQNGVVTGQNRLFEFLRREGYLKRGNRSDHNMPTQRSMDLGLFEIAEKTITGGDGRTRIVKTPKVTGKGQVYFVNLFNGNAARASA